MRRRIELDIPALTFIKLFAAAAIAFVIYKLTPLLTILALSTLLAVTLHPAVTWLQKKRLPRWAAIGLVASAVTAFLAALVLAVIPSVVDQMSGVTQNVGKLEDEVMHRLPPGRIREFVGRMINNPAAVFGNLTTYFTRVGAGVLGGFSSLGFLLILTLYLLIDGKNAYAWLVAFFAPQTRIKLHRTARELSPIVFAYVSGQAITSGLVAVFVFTVMSILGVPGALLLAIIAAVFDILPVIGFIASTLTAVLMSLTVSSSTAILVVALYIAYQATENYVIVPKVYGNRMRLSTLVVLLSFAAAAPLGGIPAVLLALPVAAAYPVVERIWLRRHLGDSVVEKHQQQVESDDKKSA